MFWPAALIMLSYVFPTHLCRFLLNTAGFLPIISMNGAIVQHCEVATSNNGWIIEVVNPATDVTLWLDPDNPTSLLRWGSVLCQALATSGDEDEEDIDDRSAISE